MAKHHQKKRQRNKRQSGFQTVDPEQFYNAVLQTVEVTKTPSIQMQKADHTLPVAHSTQLLSVSAYARLEALLRLVEQHDFSPLVIPIENGLQMADTLFYAAATAPIDEKGNFLLEPFREALARWVKENPDGGKKMTD